METGMDTTSAARRMGWLAPLGAGLALALGGAGAAAQGADDAGAWTMYGRGYDNTRYSPLDDINVGNVKGLKVAYTFSLGTLLSNESTPVVIGDTLYVTTSQGPKFVHALDATTGVRKWVHGFEMPENMAQFGCCGQVNRGLAYANGKVYVGRLDGKLTALDALTGAEAWTATVVDYKQGSVITSPPLIVKNTAVIGFGGGEYGARGYLSAYDLESGALVWKTWTVPGPGDPGNETWKGDSWKTGGGVPWFVGSYDPDLNIIYFGTSNPSPWNAAVRGTGTSDYGDFTNLYSTSTVAFHGDSGRILWHLQSTPHDAWDYDGVNELVLADLEIGGATVAVMMKADRNGFFYVADRASGKLLSADAFVHVNWATGVDLETTRPIEVPEKRPRLNFKAMDVCPNLLGGKNWQPMSYNPNTGLVYIPANNLCMDIEDTEVEYRRGILYLGKEFPTKAGPGGFGGELMAWDPVKRTKVWSHEERFPFNGGTMTTAGNLVFHGDWEGWFKALDATTGEVLWKFNVGSGMGAGPMTFKLGGKQYVAIVVGRSSTIPNFLGAVEADLGFVKLYGGPVGAAMAAATPEAGILFVFSL